MVSAIVTLCDLTTAAEHGEKLVLPALITFSHELCLLQLSKQISRKKYRNTLSSQGISLQSLNSPSRFFLCKPL